MRRGFTFWRATAFAGVAILLTVGGASADIAVKDGDKIVFLGDSLTTFGMQPAGYVSLVIHGLKTAGVTARAVGAGIPGNRSDDMLARMQAHVIDQQPTWMVVSCGVNDVSQGASGVGLDAYRANMTQIVDKAQAAGIHVMILTATMLSENPNSPGNQKLSQYNEFLRNLAKTKHCLLADLNADMQRELAQLEQAGKKRGHLLTSIGAHMNAQGNMMMARGVLRTFGVDEAMLAKAQDAWLDIPAGATVATSVPVTLRQLGGLEAIATKEGKSVEALLKPTLQSRIDELLAK